MAHDSVSQNLLYTGFSNYDDVNRLVRSDPAYTSPGLTQRHIMKTARARVFECHHRATGGGGRRSPYLLTHSMVQSSS